jgi:deoxyhypusine synthase
MIYSEATIAVPLIAGYAYHKKAWTAREPRHWTKVLEQGVAV